MSIIFTNNGIKTFQQNIRLREFAEQYEVADFTPIAALDPGALNNHILAMKSMFDFSTKKYDSDNPVKKHHQKMDTPAAKHLFYYISSFTGQDAIDAKTGISHANIIGKAQQFDSMLYQYTTDRAYSKNKTAYEIALNEGLTAFDLETLGDGFITDFHFEKIGPNGFNENKRNYYSSALGISEHQKEKYTKLINDWIKNGETSLSKDDIITLIRLNKIGSSETKIVKRDVEKALYRYEALDSIETLSEKRMFKGVERLFKIGQKQAKTSINGIRPAIQEMINGIFSSKVLGGHKIKDFDMPKIHGFFTARDIDGKLVNVSQEEFDEYTKRLANGSPELLDTLQLAKRLDRNTPLSDSYKALKNPAFGKYKATSNSQSGLAIRAGREDLLENAHLHAAEHDVKLWIQAIYQGGYFDKGNSNYFFKGDVGKSTDISVGSIFARGKDFQANEALNKGFVFMKDGLNGDLRFNNGFVYQKGQEKFIQNEMDPFAAGMNYMLAKIGIVPTEENKDLQKLGISNKNLHFASFIPMIQDAEKDPRYAKLQDSVITIIAESKEELEDKISNLVYIGKRNGLSKAASEDVLKKEAARGILEEDIDGSAKNNIEFQKIAETYDSEGNKTNTYSETLNKNVTTKIEEDLPARLIRKTDLSSSEKMLAVGEKMAQSISKNNTATLSHDDMIEIVKYWSKHQKRDYYQSNSIRNYQFGAEYSKLFLPIRKAIIERIHDRSDAKIAHEYVYDHVVASIMDRAGIKRLHPVEERPLTIDDLNTFDIDISRWQKEIGKAAQNFDVNEPGHPGIVSIRMDKWDYNFTGRLIKSLYGENGEDYDIHQRKIILSELMDRMKKSINKDLFENIDIETTSEEGILRHISSSLSKYVENKKAKGEWKLSDQHRYKRTKQILDPEKSEFVQKGILTKDENGTYRLDPKYGKIEDYVEEALLDYDEAIKQQEKDASQKIDDIIDVLFKDSDVKKEKLIEFGYTEKQAELLLKQRELRKRDTAKYIQDTLGFFLKGHPGVNLQVNRATGEILLSTQDEQIRDIAKYLPRDTYREKTGRFETRLGRMNIINAVGVYDVSKYGSTKKQFSYGTHLMKIAAENSWTYSFLERAKGGEGSLGKLEYVFKAINQDLRKIEVGPGTSAYANFASLADSVPELIKSDIITSDYVDQELIDKAPRFSSKNEVASFNLIQRNMRGILKAIADRGQQHGVLDIDSSTEDIKELANNIVIGDKPIAHWNAETVTIEGYVTADNRGIGSVNQRAREVDINAIDDEFVNAPEELRRSVKDASGILRTQAEVNREAGGQERYRKNISVRRINADHSHIQELLEGKNLDSFSKAFIRNSLYTKEGGALINPYLADTLYADRSSDQKIGELAEIEALPEDKRIDEIARRKKQAYAIDFDKESKEYKFRYGVGRYVQTNAVIGFTHDSFSETVRAEKAKHAGIVKKVFFDRETQRIVSEDIINNIIKGWLEINKNKVEKYGQREIIEDITKHLQTMFEEKTINTSFSANSYFKMVEAQTEKGMHFSPIVGLGRLDKNIAGLLDELGLGFLKGQTLSKDALLWTFDEKGDYQNLKQLAGSHGVKLDGKTGDLVKKFFGSKEDLFKAITTERYKVWNDLVSIFKDGQNIGVISNTAADALKHGEFRGAMNYLFGQIKGLDDENTRNEFLSRVNSQQVFGRDKSGILSYDEKDGFVLKKQPEFINVNKLKSIVKDITGQDLGKDSETWLSGETKRLYEDRVLLERAKDHEHASFASTGKGFKYTERDVNNMAINVFDDSSIKTAREVLVKAGGEDFASRAFDSKKAGDAVYHEVLLNLKKKNFAQNYNDLVMKEGTIQSGRLNEFAEQKNMNVNVLSGILKKLGDSNDETIKISNVDTDFLERAYTANMHLQARGYNLNIGKVSEEKLIQDFNFKKIGIGDLITHYGSSKIFDDSMFGKNMLIDLSGFGVTTSKGRSSIAIPMLSSAFMTDRKEAGNEILSTLRGLHNKAQEYLNTEDLEKRALISKRMQDTVSELEDKLFRLHGKEGPIADLGSVRLMHSSSSVKSDFIDLKDENGNWKIRGKSVVEMANKGFEAHVAFVGEKQLREMLGNDYFENLKKMGISEEDYFKHIEEHGILGTVNRKPSGYVNSMATARIYLDSSIGSSELIKVSQPLGFLMHNDLDGDILGVSILTGTGKTTDNSLVHVDSAVHDLISMGKTKEANIILREESLNGISRTFQRAEDSHLFMAATAGKSMMENVRKIQELEEIGQKRNLVDDFLINGTFYQASYGEKRKNLERVWREMGQHDAFRDIMFNSTNGDLLDFKNQVAERILQTDAFNRHEAEAALSQFMHDEFDRRAIQAYAGKQGTGLVNEYAQRFRTIQSWMVQSGESNLTTRQANIVASSFITLEDKFFAAKNTGYDMSEALKKFGDVTREAFNESNADKLIDFMLNDFEILNQSWMKKQFGMQGITQDEFREAFKAFFPQGKKWNGLAVEALRTGMGTGKFSSGTTFIGPNAMYSPQAAALNAFSESSNELLKNVQNVLIDRVDSAFNNVEEFDLSSAIPDDIKQKQAKTSLMDAIKNIRIGGGGSLSKSAVGIAGSIMMAGFIGGNPSRDEDEIAMQNQMAHQRSNNTAPNLAGYNQQQVSQQQGHKGYRINVTASSPYEQQQSMNAIRQSFQGNISSNINMNINIQNNQYGPSDRDVESYFEGLL